MTTKLSVKVREAALTEIGNTGNVYIDLPKGRGIPDVCNGFWVNSSMEYTTSEDRFVWVPANAVLYITRRKLNAKLTVKQARNDIRSYMRDNPDSKEQAIERFMSNTNLDWEDSESHVEQIVREEKS